MDNNNERRIFQRLGLNVKVELSAYNVHGDVTQRITPNSINLSATGILVMSRTSFPVASSVKISFTMPGSKSVDCFGKVIRVDQVSAKGPYEIALCFTNITPEQQEKIEKFVLWDL